MDFQATRRLTRRNLLGRLISCFSGSVWRELLDLAFFEEYAAAYRLFPVFRGKNGYVDMQVVFPEGLSLRLQAEISPS